MAAKVTAEKTDTGWDVLASDADVIRVVTDGDKVFISVVPEDDEPIQMPLAVSLAQ